MWAAGKQKFRGQAKTRQNLRPCSQTRVVHPQADLGQSGEAEPSLGPKKNMKGTALAPNLDGCHTR